MCNSMRFQAAEHGEKKEATLSAFVFVFMQLNFIFKEATALGSTEGSEPANEPAVWHSDSRTQTHYFTKQ